MSAFKKEASEVISKNKTSNYPCSGIFSATESHIGRSGIKCSSLTARLAEDHGCVSRSMLTKLLNPQRQESRACRSRQRVLRPWLSRAGKENQLIIWVDMIDNELDGNKNRTNGGDSNLSCQVGAAIPRFAGELTILALRRHAIRIPLSQLKIGLRLWT